MRQIHKKSPPQALTHWRQARLAFPPVPGMVCNYEELRKAKAVLNALEQQLLKEQGGLCAYTGLQLRNKFHLEHLVPQKYCHYGQDAAYTNLVACWPAPNTPSKTPYGAQKKDDWPAPSQSHLFVSPLVTACHQRFTFNSRGQIKATQNTDLAAQATIVNLGLDHPELTALRRQALQGALSPLKKKAAYQRRLAALQQQETQLLSGQSVILSEFCFALSDVLQQRLARL